MLTIELTDRFKNLLPDTLTDFLITLIIGVTVTLIVQYHWNRRKLYNLASKIHAPAGYPYYPIVGHSYIFAGSTEKILSKMIDLSKTNELPLKLWLGNQLIFAIDKVEHLEILLNHPKSLAKDDLYGFLSPIGGQGLFIVKSVSTWKRNRKLIGPAFNLRVLNNFVSIFAEQATILTEIVDKHVGEEIDILPYVVRVSVDSICETSMGIKINAQRSESEFCEWMQRLLAISCQRMFQVWHHPDLIFYNTQLGREFQSILKKFKDYTGQVIAEKRNSYQKQKEYAKLCPEAQTAETTKMKSFIQILLELTEDEGIFSTDELRDEINTFLVAGADTTASTTGIVLVMMGMFQQFQQKIYEEVMDVVGPDRHVEHTDMPNLKFTERFIKETSRLFPIAPVIVRQLQADIDIGEAILPAGSSVVLAFISTHRSERYFPNPMKFDPDRFLPEEIAKRHPYAYVPFAGGPRTCIGKNYAMMSLKTTVAHVIRKFKIKTSYERIENIKIAMDLVMKPADGYKVTFERRE